MILYHFLAKALHTLILGFLARQRAGIHFGQVTLSELLQEGCIGGSRFRHHVAAAAWIESICASASEVALIGIVKANSSDFIEPPCWAKRNASTSSIRLALPTAGTIDIPGCKARIGSGKLHKKRS